MTDEFLISVITPFYNGNKYIKNLFSMLENNFKQLRKEYENAKLELILVNDSPSIKVNIQDYNVDFTYKIIKHERNHGIHQARVTGLNYCKGDYVLFLDQDDELLDNALLSQVNLLLKEDASIVICNAYIERKDGSTYLLYKTRSDFNLLNDLNFYLISHNLIKSPGQCLISKSYIPIEWTRYIMKKNGSDDLFLWILILEKANKFIVNKEALYIHKYTGENLSESEDNMTDSSLEIVEIASKVKCIPEEHISLLKRSREFSLKFKSSSIATKCMTILQNSDLFLYLVHNKLMRRFF